MLDPVNFFCVNSLKYTIHWMTRWLIHVDQSMLCLQLSVSTVYWCIDIGPDTVISYCSFLKGWWVDNLSWWFCHFCKWLVFFCGICHSLVVLQYFFQCLRQGSQASLTHHSSVVCQRYFPGYELYGRSYSPNGIETITPHMFWSILYPCNMMTVLL